MTDEPAQSVQYAAALEHGMPIRVRDPYARPLPLPWLVIQDHEAQAFANHEQSLVRLRERGGLSPCEAVAILEDRRWHRMDEAAALNRLAEIVKAATEALKRPR